MFHWLNRLWVRFLTLTGLLYLVPKKQLGAVALDRDMLLQARMEVGFGPEGLECTRSVYVALRGGLDEDAPCVEHLPELILFLFLRVLVDVQGLSVGSSDVFGMSQADYLSLLSDALNEEGSATCLTATRDLAFLMWATCYVSERPERGEVAVVANLVSLRNRALSAQLGVPQPKWAMVHLQGPVSDPVYLRAPFHLLWQTEHLMTAAQRARTQRYLADLCAFLEHLGPEKSSLFGEVHAALGLGNAIASHLE